MPDEQAKLDKQELEKLIDETLKRYVKEPERLDLERSVDRYTLEDEKKETVSAFLRYCISELQGLYVHRANHKLRQKSAKTIGYSIAVALPMAIAGAAYVVSRNSEISAAILIIAEPLLLYGEASNNMFSMNLANIEPLRKIQYPENIQKTIRSVLEKINSPSQDVHDSPYASSPQ